MYMYIDCYLCTWSRVPSATMAPRSSSNRRSKACRWPPCDTVTIAARRGRGASWPKQDMRSLVFVYA